MLKKQDKVSAIAFHSILWVRPSYHIWKYHLIIIIFFHPYLLDLLGKVNELEEEKADKELQSFEIKLDVKPEYHPKIIGHKGSVISNLRKNYKVNIQLPKKDHPEQSIITITGYEDNANEAKGAILKIVHEFVSIKTSYFLLLV